MSAPPRTHRRNHDRRWRCPTSRRSRCCRSRTCRATRSRNISPTAWSRRSSPRSAASAGCSSSRAIRVSPTKAIDVKRVGRELGVRYVLEGSVRKAGRRVRITGQLIDANTGAHLWADRFDGSLEDVFDLQDKVASSVAGVIEPALQAAETARSARRPTADLTAYDLYLRAYTMAISSGAQFPEALRLLEQAIERDPRYGPALAYAAV